jgi:hypothetical protein
MELAGGRIGKIVLQVLLGRVRLVFPASAAVQLHPVILSILNFASVLESLGEQVPKVVVVGCVFETEVADVGKVLVEFLCMTKSVSSNVYGLPRNKYLDILRRDL